jgi:hypothetical protein
MRTGQTRQAMMRDALLALLVVALTFLNFGHTSAVFADGGRVVVTGHSICGDTQPVNDGEHYACHACRPAAAMLPPPPAGVEPVCFVAIPVRYAEIVRSPVARPATLSARPRGPPAAA